MGSKDLADLATWIRERLEAMGLTELMIRAFTIIYGSLSLVDLLGMVLIWVGCEHVVYSINWIV